jgi:signal peptidase II
MKQRLAPLLISLAVFAADRASKAWIDRNVTAWDIWPVVPGLFNIIHAENRGMAFSILENASGPVRSFVLLGVAGLVLVFVGWMLWHATSRLHRLALALVFGGALGNLYDRVLRGSVTDFLDFYFRGWHWATFNIADSAITVGAVLLALDLAFAREKPAQKQTTA